MRARDLPTEGLVIFTVYGKPLDYPGIYVCRRWWLRDGLITTLDPERNRPFARADSLEAIRRRLPWGLICIGRNDNDDPVIVENWV